MKNLYLILIALSLPGFLSAQVTFLNVYQYPVERSSRDVVVTSDGGYLIAGETATQYLNDSDILIVKLDNTGVLQWTKQYGGNRAEYPYSITPTTDGNYLIVGFTETYGAGGEDVWLLKIDPSGNLLWSKTYGTTGDEEGKEIIPTSDGNYIIVGTTDYSAGNPNDDAFLKKIDLSGNELWTKYYGSSSSHESGHSVKQCSDGGFILTGQTTSTDPNGDIYLVRTDPNGNQTWAHTYGGANNDEGNFVLANSDGTFVISAETNSNAQADSNVQVMKVDASGGVIWSKIYGGTDKEVARTIRPTSDGGYIEAATSRSFGWINPKMWLLRLNANGDTIWTQHYGSYYHNHGYAAKQTADGGFIAIGHQEDVNGVAHILAVKTNADGTVAPVGINEIAGNTSFNVFPNPSNGIFNIQLPTNDSRTISIGDALGNVVKVIPSEYTFLNIDLADKPKGVYFVTIRTAEASITKKIVVR